MERVFFSTTLGHDYPLLDLRRFHLMIWQLTFVGQLWDLYCDAAV
jgi:hypothetical protein